MERNPRKLTWLEWITLGFGAFFLLLALPWVDTSMNYFMVNAIFLGSGSGGIMLSLWIGGAALFLELFFLRLEKARWLAWVMPVLGILGLALAEFFWHSGGWDRIGSSLLLPFAFPLLYGPALAVLLRLVLRQGAGVRIAAGVLAVVIAVAAFILWPRPIQDVVSLEFEDRMIYVDSDGIHRWMRTAPGYEDELLTETQYLQAALCLVGPDLDQHRYILARVDAEHVIVAIANHEGYIYRYTGDLEDFEPQGLCWLICQGNVYHSLFWTAAWE